MSRIFRSRRLGVDQPFLGGYLGGGFSGEVLDVLADFFFVLDEGGVCLDLHVSSRNNPAAFRKFLGRKIFVFLPSDVAEIFSNHFNRFLATGKAERFEYVLRDEGGESFFEAVYLPFRWGKILLVIWDVSEKKKVEGALREIEAYYKAISEMPYTHICRWLPDTTLTFVNEAYAKTYGRRPEELVGTKWIDLVPEESREEVLSRYRELAENPRTCSYEHQVRDAGGGVKWILWVDYPLRDSLGRVSEFQSVGVDVTSRRNAEEALRRSEERYRNIFENAFEGIFQSTPDGRYLAVNPSFARMFGFDSPEEMISQVTDIGRQLYVNPEDRLRFVRELSEKGFVSNFEVEVVRRDGQRIWISINARAVKDKEGKIIYYEGTNEDVTLRRKAEEELRRHSLQLESMVSERTKELEAEKNRVQELLYARTQLINQLSHDLRTPLTPITALLPLIGKSISDEKDKKRFEIVLKNVDYMKRLLADTLSIARLDSGSVSINRVSFNLRSFVDEILSGYEVVFSSANMRAENLVPDSIVVSADELRIREVFDNLINNSVKYSPNGGVIRVSAEESSGEVVVSVSDEGVGVDKKDLGNLFMEFYRGGDRNHSVESVGLGLAICKRIVEKHGGRIWAESEGLGRGLTVKFTLPVGVRA